MNALGGGIVVLPSEGWWFSSSLLTIVALAHTNVRAGYGFFSLFITGPQYHRIHHSNHPEHIDKNFAQLFPLWDVIFGTAWRPKAGEFPATGLVGATCRQASLI